MKADLKEINYRKEETMFKVKHSVTQYQQFEGDTGQNSRGKKKGYEQEIQTKQIICGMQETGEGEALKRGYSCLPDYSTFLFHTIPKE